MRTVGCFTDGTDGLRPAEAATRLGRDIVDRSVPALLGHVYGAGSTVGKQLGSIYSRRIQAEDALTAVRGRPGTRFARYEDVQPQVILNEIRQILSERPDLRRCVKRAV